MQLVNNLIKLPEMAAVMQEMSQEMMKAGIIDEMVQDAIEMGDEDDLEEEAEGEVEKLLFELTDGMLGQAGAVGPALEVFIIVYGVDRLNFTFLETKGGTEKYGGQTSGIEGHLKFISYLLAQ